MPLIHILTDIFLIPAGNEMSQADSPVSIWRMLRIIYQRVLRTLSALRRYKLVAPLLVAGLLT